MNVRTHTFVAAVAIITLILTATSHGRPQSQTRDTAISSRGSAVVSGRVVEAETGRPVNRVLVSIAIDGREGGHGTLTNSDGQFVLANLPAGRYTRLFAHKPAYIDAYYGSRRPGIPRDSVAISLTEGQRLTGIELTLVRGGVISGTVVDGEGHPLRRSPVTLVPLANPTPINPQVMTDDRGVYRAFGLLPGEWIVLSASQRWSVGTPLHTTTDEEARWAEQLARGTAGASLAPPPSARGEAVTYTPVYFPGTTDPAAATLITLKPGEERLGVDFSVPLVPASRIGGTVTGMDGQPAADVNVQARLQHEYPDWLLPLRETTVAPSVRTDPDGRFQLSGLPPGRYAVMAQATSAAGRASGPAIRNAWALAEIVADGRDVTGLSLALRPGMTLRGRLVFDAPPDVARPPRVSVAAMSHAAGLSMVRRGATIAPDGSFAIEGLTPGNYRIEASAALPGPAGAGAPSWTARSAALDGRDLLDEPVTIDPGAAIDGVVVTFTHRETELAGSLVDPAGRPTPDYFVFVFPANRASWYQGSRRLRPPFKPDADGRFTIRQLPPGEYYLCALTEFLPGEIYRSSFLAQLVPSAIRLTLVEGERRAQDVRIARTP